MLSCSEKKMRKQEVKNERRAKSKKGFSSINPHAHKEKRGKGLDLQEIQLFDKKEERGKRDLVRKRRERKWQRRKEEIKKEREKEGKKKRKKEI